MTKVLFICFIDFDEPPKSGSMVRPHQMFNAFREAGCDVDLISGKQNSFSARWSAYKRCLRTIKEKEYDFCYVELPSGPMFFQTDRIMLNKIFKRKIPILYFYRDCYWRFPELFYKSSRIIDKIKYSIINKFHKIDLNLIHNTSSLVYFPTESARKFSKVEKSSLLPPGCSEAMTDLDIPLQKRPTPTGIYVGGATYRYGMDLLLNSFKLLNQYEVKSKLIIVCNKNAWEDYCKQYHFPADSCSEWLDVRHVSPNMGLELAYKNSDYAILPLMLDAYNNMALPIKMLEYCSYLKPIVATDSKEVEEFVSKFQIGLVAKDNCNDFSNKIAELTRIYEEDFDCFSSYIDNCRAAAESNTWLKRVQKVIKDAEELSGYSTSDS